MVGGLGEKDKMEAILDYWIEHNDEHARENLKWLKKAEEFGNPEVVNELRAVIEISEKISHHVREAKKKLKLQDRESDTPSHLGGEHLPHRHVSLHQIGTLRTPYPTGTSFASMKGKAAECRIILDNVFVQGLQRLDTFTHIIVLFYFDRLDDETTMTVTPPRAGGVKTGLFATRDPNRPNPIGMSIVRLKQISGNVLLTEGIDAYDGSPLLDIKPYAAGAAGDAGDAGATGPAKDEGN
jgi:tRNA-Thr(GGU) m(6)t(6)A37 methyltransferase TsaA